MNTTVFYYEVGYKLQNLPGFTQTVRHGYFAQLVFAPQDASGRNLSARQLKVNSVELVGPGGKRIPFV